MFVFKSEIFINCEWPVTKDQVDTLKLAVFCSLSYVAVETYDSFEPSTLISTLNVKI